MKNKDIISGVVGAGFFAVGYLGLLLPIAPALALGAAGVVASELVFHTNQKEEEREITLKERILDARKKNKHIKEMTSEVENSSVKEDLEEIVKTTTKIINTIEKENLKNSTVNKFFDYYLPVCVKIVDRYDEIENQSLTSKDSMKFMSDSTKIISDTNNAFKKILNSLYQNNILKADAEMKVYNSMLKADGYEEEIVVEEMDNE